MGNFCCCSRITHKKIPFTISPANGRAIFTICGLKGNWIWADGMLHRCAFDARSSATLSAHPWNLPYDSRASLSPKLFASIPLLFALLLNIGVRILSLFPRKILLSRDNGKSLTLNTSTSFSMDHFLLNIFPSHIWLSRIKIFRCAASRMERKNLFFSGKPRKIYSQTRSAEKYFKVYENNAADVREQY